MERRERGADVVDELERLGHDRAVERVVRDVRRVCEVADDRRLGVALRRHQDVAALDSASEPRRVVRRRDLEHAAADVHGVRADELLDVDAVDRRAALEAPVRVYRRHAAQVSERGRASTAPRDVPGAYGAEPHADGLRYEAAAVHGSTVGQGRDHTASWPPPSQPRTAGTGSSSSPPTWTTGCSRSARRWRCGRGTARPSSC